MAEHTDNPPSDAQIDQAFQRAIDPLQPSPELDQQILNLAEQQTKQAKVVPLVRRKSWAGAPLWASAASIGCVGVLGWWLWQSVMHDPSLATPSELSYQNEALRSVASPSSVGGVERRDHELQRAEAQQSTSQARILQESARAVAKQSIASDMGGEPAIKTPSLSVFEAASALSDEQRHCIRDALADLRPEQLARIAIQDLSLSQQQAITLAATKIKPNLALHWQQQAWYLLPFDPSWWLVPQSVNLESTFVYIFPDKLRHHCQNIAQ
ncbi:hypothetical protein [Agarivorans sp. QJM3NY_25]|uniref:hypothetical protein n=1 Tax=Agarivorans sp. QJM3NY_25 TaxID=3421430 RepID=UPI003D7D4193